MADTKLRIFLETIYKGTGISKAGGELTGLGQRISGVPFGALLSGSMGAVAAITALGLAAKKTVEEFVAYGKEVRDLSLRMGTNTEEASRLIQVSDDLQVSSGTVSAAMRKMSLQGIQPSIAGMAELADKYVALEDPVKRNQLLMKNFGRAGLEMARVMLVGGDALKDMARNIDDTLVLTEEEVKKTEDWFRATDALDDALKGMRYTIGSELIPTLVAFIEFFTPTAGVITKTTAAVNEFDDSVLQLSRGMVQLNDGTWITRQAFLDMVPTLEENRAAMELAADEGKNAYLAMLGLGSSTSTATSGVEGLSEANLALVTSLQAVSDAEIAQLALTNINQAYKDGTIDSEEYNDMTWTVMDTLTDLPESEIQARMALLGLTQQISDGTLRGYAMIKMLEELQQKLLDVRYSDVRRPATSGRRSDVTRNAHGGPLTGVNLVGEQGPELVVGKTVIPADLTKRLLRLGVEPGRKFLGGGLLDGLYQGNVSSTPVPGSQVGWNRPDWEPSDGGGGGGASLTPAMVEVFTFTQAAIAQVEATIPPAIQQAVATSAVQVEAAFSQLEQKFSRLQNEARMTNEKMDTLIGAVMTRATDTGITTALQKTDFRG